MQESIKHLYNISVTNLALNKPAWQDSTKYGAVASRAVDGNVNANFAAGSCTHSSKHTYPTWGVDLQIMSVVYHVDIKRRRDAPAHGMHMGHQW